MMKLTSVPALVLLAGLLISCSSEDRPAVEVRAAEEVRPAAEVHPAGEVPSSLGEPSRFFQLAASIDASTLKNNAPCAVDSINGQVAAGEVINADRKGELRLVGWASTRDKRSPEDFTINLVDTESGTTYAAISATGKARPDVARVLGAPSLELAGFDAVFGLAQITPGTYDVLLTYSDGGSSMDYCSTEAKVYVGKPVQ